MVIRAQPDVGNAYSHPLPLGLSLEVRGALQRVRKEADLERANQLRSASVPNHEWPCQRLIISHQNYQENQAEGTAKGFQFDLALFDVGPCEWAKCHIMRHQSVLFYVVCWKGCYWVFEGVLWYVRRSVPCERIKLIIHVNMSVCKSFDACSCQFSVLSQMFSTAGLWDQPWWDPRGSHMREKVPRLSHSRSQCMHWILNCGHLTSQNHYLTKEWGPELTQLKDNIIERLPTLHRL